MNVNDKIYGKEEIKEQVLIDLINSQAVQRLKGISQYGLPDEYYYKKGFSRYDHSIGVMILLKRLGASMEEQMAGLLHDISHTAFSHLVDWVIGDPEKEDYQDNVLLKVIEKSDIPRILEKHGFDYKLICDLEKFPLLEKEAPFICADRIDYTLREMFYDGDTKSAIFCFDNLISYDSQIVFKKLEAAEIFANCYAVLQKDHWSGQESKARYHIMSKVLKQALSKNLISFEDLWKTDYDVIHKLIKSENENLLNDLNLLRRGFIIREKSGGIELKKKFRYVDPLVLVDNNLFNLTDVSKSYKNYLEIQKQESNLIKSIEVLSK